MFKRLFLFIWLSMMMVFSAVQAETYQPFAYVGNMQVINCSEWVSLRETPSTAAKRLVKVSLGSVVHNCYSFTDEWYYAEFDGYGGYILADYLKPCENETAFSAMLVTNCEYGTDWYPTVNSEIAFDFLPADCIVRNCSLAENGRVYAEFGGRSGFISREHVEVYSNLLHYPLNLTMSCNLYKPVDSVYQPALKTAWKAEFPLISDEYSEYVQEDDDEILHAQFVLYSEATVSNVQLFQMEIQTFDDDTGEAIFTATFEHITSLVDAAHPLYVSTSIQGVFPNFAVGYMDSVGVYRFFFVEISGEDGALLLREF